MVKSGPVYRAGLSSPSSRAGSKNCRLPKGGTEQDRLIAQLQEDVGWLQIEVKQQQTIISPPIVAQEVRESRERVREEAEIACPSQRDGLSLGRTCCRIRYAPTVALP
jgi:hypothetical protein